MNPGVRSYKWSLFPNLQILIYGFIGILNATFKTISLISSRSVIIGVGIWSPDETNTVM